MDITLSGITRDSSVEYIKAWLPIVCTFPRSMLFSLAIGNARSPIATVLAGSVYVVPCAAGYATTVDAVMSKSTPSTEIKLVFPFLALMDVSEVVP